MVIKENKLKEAVSIIERLLVPDLTEEEAKTAGKIIIDNLPGLIAWDPENTPKKYNNLPYQDLTPLQKEYAYQLLLQKRINESMFELEDILSKSFNPEKTDFIGRIVFNNLFELIIGEDKCDEMIADHAFDVNLASCIVDEEDYAWEIEESEDREVDYSKIEGEIDYRNRIEGKRGK